MQDKNIKEVIEYIKYFLLRDNELVNFVSYGDVLIDDNVRVVIVPDSSFWDNYGKKESIPRIPLEQWEGIPFLFGKNKVEKKENKIYIYADIIASTLFLISRYEEMVLEENKDRHGRYMGKKSIPFLGGFIERPVVDEYGIALRSYLRQEGLVIDEEKQALRNIYLTHDIDVPWKQYKVWDAIKQSIKNLLTGTSLAISPLLNCVGIYSINPYDTFDWLLARDKSVQERYKERCRIVYFVLANQVKTSYTNSYINDIMANDLLEKLCKNAVEVGLHESYEAGENIGLIGREQNVLEVKVRDKITVSRNHYLRLINFDAMHEMVRLGITEDFSMGYADCAGFRLGTAREVKWIDPRKVELTQMKLHPLNIMDNTLYEAQYLGLSNKDAWQRCKTIVDNIKSVNGDFCFLCHNSNLKQKEFEGLEKLYADVLDYLIEEG